MKRAIGLEQAIGIIFVLKMVLPMLVYAQEKEIRLGWTPNSESHLSHYHLYRDTLPATIVYLDAISRSDSTYTDVQVEFGKTYYYKLTAVDSFGNESDFSNEVMVFVDFLSGNLEEGVLLPQNFRLEQNYPNPFNPSTVIEYSITVRSRVQVKIINVLGEVVRHLVDGFQGAGKHRVSWDGTDEAGRLVSGGIYFYQMTARNYQEVKKLLYQK